MIIYHFNQFIITNWKKKTILIIYIKMVGINGVACKPLFSELRLI